MRKAIFLGVTKIHSNKKNQDYRKVEFFTPPFKDERGYMRGGVESVFTDLDSTLGNGIEYGSIVEPEFHYDHYVGRDQLVDIKVIAPSPYSASDFD